MIAAVGSDGISLVVWGLGETEEAAEADARSQVGFEDPTEVALTCLPCSDRAAEIVRTGEINCEGNGPLVLVGLRPGREIGEWRASRLMARSEEP